MSSIECHLFFIFLSLVFGCLGVLRFLCGWFHPVGGLFVRDKFLLWSRDSRVLVHFGSPVGSVYGCEVVFESEVG